MIETVITTIDAEIARLREARALIAGNNPNLKTSLFLVKPKRKLSAEGRARIVAAQKKRWAKR